ncbi:putative secreted protein (Por secretion system target) [Aquimarina sp. MAR_2010_214]|uniref:cellulase family glycosylhydrolase n=1 Tax=Aquimarina sp. MAR_2010_214 TaxID=1250026 RepID=UPI000C700BDD|nr:cellulase family glycosylhydrolase [Aquimarina sp. MAR_2010_214]PKV50177.1 putative secreted protein (Por secretion system target) [Aquimarina sp. MAR_2010_214]
MNINNNIIVKYIAVLQCVFWMHMGCITYAQTPVTQNGQLRVCGTQLCNQYNKPIQLRGMSTHGIQWYGWDNCLTESSLDALAYDWDADILRISVYVQEGGYETDPVKYTNQVSRLINEATERGMYALVDWHQLSPGDPNTNLENAKRFFTDIANLHKDKNNIIYDVCNEPNGSGVTWNRIKTYADQIIPVIRAIDNDAVVLVGTHGWATFGVSGEGNLQDVINNQLQFDNIMYTFHFYAKSHRDTYLNTLDKASNQLPVFVTEFGSQEYTGDGPNDFTMTQRYIDLMQQKKISWTSWNYSDDFRSGASWKTGTCSEGLWTTDKLKEAGKWIRNKIKFPADDFPGGIGNSPPTVSITSPNQGETFIVGATINITANASDTDGTINKVEFYNGNSLLGKDTSSPYSFDWSNVAVGSYTIKAKAIDNEGGEATASILVTVNDNNGDSCTAPDWVSGQAYNGGDIVSYQGHEYKAKWWSNQNPVGSTEWEDLGACDGTPPNNNTCTAPAWASGKAYNGGDVVSHQKHEYKAKWWTNQNPVGSTEWKDLGACTNKGNRATRVSLTIPTNGNDGVVTTSNISMIESNKKSDRDIDVKVFPNPFEDLLYIRLPKILSETYKITLYNSTGIKVLEYQESSNNKIIKTFDLNTLESGLYFYKIKLYDETYLGRIVKK